MAKRNEDGSITSIYVHFDGYPSGVGRKLVEHYQDEEKLDALLALGDLSILGPELGEQHDFDSVYDYRKLGYKSFSDFFEGPEHKLWEKWCLAYHRDRGEAWDKVKPQTFDGRTTWEAMLRDSWAKFAYLWEGGRWKCWSVGSTSLVAKNIPREGEEEDDYA